MRYVLVCLLLSFSCGVPATADWLTLPSTYSHDPVTGRRVHQYRPVEAPTAPVAANFRSSGYTHTRSTLTFGPSRDNYHRVEQWGDPVRPYDEWRFPYRPYSTPYPYWGEPYGGLNLGFGPGRNSVRRPVPGRPALRRPGLRHPGLGQPGGAASSGLGQGGR